MRNEGITNSSPLLNDTKKLHRSYEINGLKNTQKFEGSGIRSLRVKIFTHNWVNFIIDFIMCTVKSVDILS